MPTATEIAEFLGARIVGPTDPALVRDIVDDSRTVCPGDAYLAIPGTRQHGLDFEDDVVSLGAALVVSDRPARRLPTVIVEDPRRVAGPLADWFHRRPSTDLAVHGVTGTNGKSSTSAMIHAGLVGAGREPGLLSGIEISGPGVAMAPTRTTPEATVVHRTLDLFRRGGCDSAVVEVSSHAAVHRRVDGVRFRSMALTNLTPEHLDFHGSMEAYYQAKTSLFTADRTGRAVVCVDDDHGRRLAREAGIPVTTCSVSDTSADVHAVDIHPPDADADHLGHRVTVRTPSGHATIRLQVWGPHQVANAVVAMAVLVGEDLPADAVAQGISALRTIPGRCEPVSVGQPFIALVDHMHNVAGQRATLPYLRARTPGRLIVVIGATGDRDPAKRSPLGATAASYADLVVVTDESPGDEDPAAVRAAVRAGADSAARATVVEIADRDAAFRAAVTGARRGDTIVVAGRGSDRHRRFGARTVTFDDRAQLARAIEDVGRG